MLIDILLLTAGLALLFAGGEGLVRGAVALATRLGMSPLVVGLVIVGFGTSTPELLVSVQAALAGSPDIAVGNVVGSNIANILLIVGLAGLIYPMAASFGDLKRDLIVMSTVALFMILVSIYGSVGRPIGALMFLSLLGYLGYVYMSERQTAGDDATEKPAGADQPVWLGIAFAIGGLVMLFFGADLLVTTATRIARDFGISEAVIGLTIVAIGTSLPEMATAVIAALRRHSDVAIGNVVGSNIFNILGILGLTAVIAPVSVADQIARFDIPVMLGVSLALVAIIATRNEIGRIAAGLLLAGYGVYLFMLF